MDANATLKRTAEAYVVSDHVRELRARLQMSAFHRKHEQKRIKEDATEQLRHSVGFYQAGFFEQIMLMWTIASWVRWILKQVFTD